MTDPGELSLSVPDRVVSATVSINLEFPYPIPGDLAQQIILKLWEHAQEADLVDLNDPRVTQQFKAKISAAYGFKSL